MSMECKNTDIESLFQSWEPEVKALLAVRVIVIPKASRFNTTC